MLMLMNVLKEESHQRFLGSINNMVKPLLTADMMGNTVIVYAHINEESH